MDRVSDGRILGWTELVSGSSILRYFSVIKLKKLLFLGIFYENSKGSRNSPEVGLKSQFSPLQIYFINYFLEIIETPMWIEGNLDRGIVGQT